MQSRAHKKNTVHSGEDRFKK